MTAKDEWLTAHSISDTMWRISDNRQDNIYLVVGRKRALIVDTGWGAGNLRALVAQMTPLPLIVVNTHGHIDHALGNDSFDEICIATPDGARLDRERVAEKRAWIMDSTPLTAVQTVPSFTLWGTHGVRRDVPLEDGMEIDLGDRVVTAFLTPGHTAGSACFLDGSSRVLLAGDSFVPSDAWGPMWFHLKESVSLSGYLQRMGKLVAGHGFAALLSGHGECGLIPLHRLTSLLEGIRMILDGKVTGKPQHTFAGDGLRTDFDGVSLVYDPDKL